MGWLAFVVGVGVAAGPPPITDDFTAESAEGAENGLRFLHGGWGFGALQDTVAWEAAERGANLRVWLLTIGQGDAIWERFGHNAIRVLDETTGIDAAWNYGMFDFEEPGYLGRLVRGEMMYWVQPYDGAALIDFYIRTNRSVWLQELNLTPAQKADLNDFLMWNGRDENRFYRYDYYRDNCSTRVRDALDRVLDGALAAALQARTGRSTYREHTQRLLSDRLAEGTGTLLAMGPRTDRPLSAWEEAFLPVQLMEQIRTVEVQGPDGTNEPLVLDETVVFTAQREPESTVAPDRVLPFSAAGIGLAALLLLLGRPGTGRATRIGFAALAFAWALTAGVFGTVIAGLWAFTEHSFTYNNENLLQASPLLLLLAVLIPFGTRLSHQAARLAVVIAGLAVLGFLLQILPGLDQANGEIIGLLMPAHIAVAVGLSIRPGKSSSPKDT